MKMISSLAKTLCAGAVLLAFPAPSDAQIVKQGSGYKFRLKFTKGAKSNFSANVNVHSPTKGQPGMTMKSGFTNTVKSLSGDTATIEVKTQPMTMGTSQVTQAQTVTMKQNTRGKVVSTSGGQLPGSQVMFPEGPIKVGHTWSQETEFPALGQGMKVNAKYKFNGIKTVSGKQVAEIGLTLSGAGQMSFKGTGKLFLLVSDGSIWKMTTDATLSGKGQNGQPGFSQKMTFVVQRK